MKVEKLCVSLNLLWSTRSSANQNLCAYNAKIFSILCFFCDLKVRWSIWFTISKVDIQSWFHIFCWIRVPNTWQFENLPCELVGWWVFKNVWIWMFDKVHWTMHLYFDYIVDYVTRSLIIWTAQYDTVYNEINYYRNWLYRTTYSIKMYFQYPNYRNLCVRKNYSLIYLLPLAWGKLQIPFLNSVWFRSSQKLQ